MGDDETSYMFPRVEGHAYLDKNAPSSSKEQMLGTPFDGGLQNVRSFIPNLKET